jgi:hypothetical protein
MPAPSRPALFFFLVALLALAGGCANRLAHHSAEDQPFEMDLPAGWEIQMGVANSDVAATHQDSDLKAVVLLAARAWRLEQSRTLDIYARQRLNVYLLEHPELSILEEGEMTVDGQAAHLVVISGRVNDQDVMALHVYGLNAEYAYLIAGQIVSATDGAGVFEKYRELFMKAAASFRFKSERPAPVAE